MADEIAPPDKRGSSALSQGAARFDTLARDLKTRQIAENSGVVSTPYREPAISPDEVWAKNFMTQEIAPRLQSSPMADFVPPMPALSFDFAVPKPIESATPQVHAPTVIGAHLGKPEAKRSWLGRLLRPKAEGTKQPV